MASGRTGRVAAGVLRILLAGGLTASHAIATSPYLYPHYVILILVHPWVLHRGFGIRLAPWQIAWIGVSLVLHPLGGLFGLYRTVWWFDHLTHTTSAILVAAIGYVLARALFGERRYGPWIVAGFTMAFVMALGHAWEVIETHTHVLTVYGPNDTFWDYVFDFLGGLGVVAFGRFVLAERADELREQIATWRGRSG